VVKNEKSIKEHMKAGTNKRAKGTYMISLLLRDCSLGKMVTALDRTLVSPPAQLANTSSAALAASDMD
jgi:hypothetical protein